MELSNEILNYFIFTSITELFSIYIKLCIFLTNHICFYFIFLYHIICFLAPGLYIIEYKFLKNFFFISIFLGILSIFFFYNLLIPTLFNFFLSFQKNYIENMNLYFEAKISDYVIFYKDIYFSCFFSFQICVILVFVASYFSQKIKLLKIVRKFFYILLLFFSTVLTPPDIFSQIFMFFSLILCFEGFIFINIFKAATQKY